MLILSKCDYFNIKLEEMKNNSVRQSISVK